MVAIVGSLNKAYDIEEGRPWWKVRLIAVGLTLSLALMLLLSFTLIVIGPTLAERLATAFRLGPAFEWTWKIVQWPLAFVLVSTAIGLVYYFAPDAEQDWAWITPGALTGTILWFGASLGFKYYAANFTDYNAAYGAVAGVIVLLLWFYISAVAILIGAEMNAEIEHASPHGKAPGEKVPGEKKKIGAAAARAYDERIARRRDDRRMVMAATRDERSLGEMIADLSRDTRLLVQQEIQLAKKELSDKASLMGKGAVLVLGGGLLAYGGLLALLATLVLLLIKFGLAAWLAALIGAVVAAAAGYVLIRVGLASFKPGALTPQQTIETLKEDAQWLKSQAR
jgi:uncharacterized BrkB/YihY/UPF0761 family membrane protein